MQPRRVRVACVAGVVWYVRQRWHTCKRTLTVSIGWQTNCAITAEKPPRKRRIASTPPPLRSSGGVVAFRSADILLKQFYEYEYVLVQLIGHRGTVDKRGAAQSLAHSCAARERCTGHSGERGGTSACDFASKATLFIYLPHANLWPMPFIEASLRCFAA